MQFCHVTTAWAIFQYLLECHLDLVQLYLSIGKSDECRLLYIYISVTEHGNKAAFTACGFKTSHRRFSVVNVHSHDLTHAAN